MSFIELNLNIPVVPILFLKALQRSLTRTKPAIFNTDQGVQFTVHTLWLAEKRRESPSVWTVTVVP